MRSLRGDEGGGGEGLATHVISPCSVDCLEHRCLAGCGRCSSDWITRVILGNHLKLYSKGGRGEEEEGRAGEEEEGKKEGRMEGRRRGGEKGRRGRGKKRRRERRKGRRREKDERIGAYTCAYCMKSRGERRNYIKLAGEWCVCV